MNIVGITRIRNEEEIIKDTIEHYLQWCSKLYIYDDCSTDNTVLICKSFGDKVMVVEGKHWDTNRTRAEFQTRQFILEIAQIDNPDWILYFDADERIEWNFNKDKLINYDVVNMKLYDFYITEEDKNKNYKDRTWIGREYRQIPMLFRNNGLSYTYPDQRIANYPANFRILMEGYVKHYGKAISIKQWEDTCDYYANYFPEPYKTKWNNRRGKAIHNNLSDFGTELIKWEDKDKLGIRIG